MSEVAEAVAEAEITADVKNISEADLTAMLSGSPEPVVPDEEAEQEEVESEEIAESNVLSDLDLDSLSEGEIKQLSEALSSRAVDRFGQLTARAKAAEERARELESSMKAQQDEILSSTSSIEENPYADLKTVKDIQEKAKEINGVIEWAEDVLFESADYGPDEAVTESNGQSMTKAEVRSALKQARKSRDKFLPDQFRNVKKTEDAVRLRQEYGNKAMNDFKWLSDQESDQAKQFAQLAGHPDLQEVYSSNPELSWLPYIIAAAVDGFSKPGAKPQNAKKAFAPSPPKSPATAGSISDKGESSTSKTLKDLRNRFRETGSMQSFQKLREASFASQT